MLLLLCLDVAECLLMEQKLAGMDGYRRGIIWFPRGYPRSFSIGLYRIQFPALITRPPAIESQNPRSSSRTPVKNPLQIGILIVVKLTRLLPRHQSVFGDLKRDHQRIVKPVGCGYGRATKTGQSSANVRVHMKPLTGQTNTHFCGQCFGSGSGTFLGNSIGIRIGE